MREIEELPAGRLVVVGVGNTLRGDDAAGPLVARRLRERHADVVFDAGDTPENFMAPVRRAGPEVVLLIDAADFGGRPGEVRMATASEVDGLMLGTHAAPLSMFMRVVEQETAAHVRLLAVQATETGLGAEPTERVAETVDGLAEMLEGELDRRSGK